ncbi:MAG: F0F1 ATP synthase subunit gamma [Alphaproteobacteria bacterium]|jgi:F-type H+-transporting ATPase subunit gamma|nr:F0F1 ATP synthase subunit gamma [Alphaproteobacteria bacterium]MBT7944210.1 F0F1 ATP synthase subunit gamma [Alphaproteobacteria bacterium]
MSNLKDLKVRISSVKSTQKITSAMKMVAAAKLRKAQENAEAARPFAGRMERMVSAVADSVADTEGAPPLLAGTGKAETHLIVACTADRGLCGGFNSSIARQVRTMVLDLKRDGKTVKILCVGRKGRDNLKRDFAGDIIDTVEGIGRRGVEYGESVAVADQITALFEGGFDTAGFDTTGFDADGPGFDVCTIVFNRFQSAMTQIPTAQQLIPFVAPETENGEEDEKKPVEQGPQPIFIFEPDEAEILAELLPRNLGIQVFQALLESAASEHGARMTSMENATRNAGDMIDKLTLTYNRTRQAAITTELVEIVSGAEAL